MSFNPNTQVVDEEQDIVKSSFNNAVFKNIRMNDAWQMCNKYSRSGELDKWKWVLDVIWRELAAAAKKKDEKRHFTKLIELNKNIATAGRDPIKLYNALDQKDIYLRILEDELGLGIKWQENEYDDF